MKQLGRLSLIVIISALFFVRCGNDQGTGFTPDNPGTTSGGTHQIVPHDFLSEDDFNQLKIEVTYVGNYQPQAASLDALKTFLEGRLHKSGGITITTSSISSPGKSTYSISDISALEKEHRSVYASGKKLSAWFVFVDGDYSENKDNSKVLGVAYTASSMAIFEKTIQSLSGGLGQPSTHIMETSVMEHEFCHILGLVNNGTDMVTNHQDMAHGKHCNNKNCLMYYATETSDFVANFFGGSIPTLDDNCIQDLQNNGGK
ncbi:MAG TPA: hypothetical protein VKA27_17345 [Sunxiuqinia sp.]|nr:hypothetical protein [Sunxiuqinia sp.]